jgi:hypothetical protein
VSGTPSQTGDFSSQSVFCPEIDCVVPASAAAVPLQPQVALRLALARAIDARLIGAEDALRAMAAIERLDERSETAAG